MRAYICTEVKKMIAMLEMLSDERHTIFKKFDYITPRKISAKLFFAGAVQMVSVTHREHVRGINWKGLESITEAKDWLLPKGIKCPSKCSIRPFKPKHLPCILMDNTALNVLASADIKPSALTIGIYPTDNTLPDAVMERAREIRILCDECSEEYAQDIMDRFGAAVVCGNSEDIFAPCQMVIASADSQSRARASKNALLFSPSPNQRQALHVRTTVPQAPEVYSYPTRLFGALNTLSALYELENRRELAMITPFLARLEEGLITSAELSRYLRTLV